MLIQHVETVRLENELVVLIIFAHMNFMAYRQIGLEEIVASSILHDAVFDDSPTWITMQSDEVAATFRPLAGGIWAVYSEDP